MMVQENIVLRIVLLSLLLQLRTMASALSLPFLEMGTSSVTLTGTLSHGGGQNSNPIPISLPSSSGLNGTQFSGLPFSNDIESLVFVNVNGFLSFRTPRDYSAPEHRFFSFFSPSFYSHIIAPYWTAHDLSLGGEVRYEVHDDGNGTVLDYVNSVVSQEVGVAFEGVWLLLVHWDHVPSTADPTQRDSYQLVLVTDGSKSYVLFLYHCGLLQSSNAAIGYSASLNFSEDHRWSLDSRSAEVACADSPHSNWSSLLYSLHYDGVRAMIHTSPEGPVYQAGQYYDFRCRALTPGPFTYQWEIYCSDGRRLYQSTIRNNATKKISLPSTPTLCLDIVVCKTWDDSGAMAETRFSFTNITGVGLLNVYQSVGNNSGIKANPAHQLGVVSCHSASTAPHIGRWVDTNGEEIPIVGHPIFDIQFHSGTYHSYTTLSVKNGSEFRASSEGVYSCIIPDETGVERTLHFGLYDNTFNPVPSSHPLTIQRTSEHPFTLTCTSTYLPPYALQWLQNTSLIQDNSSSFSLSTRLTDRHTSSYCNTLVAVVATGNGLVGTTYTCGVSGLVQSASSGPRTQLSHFSYAAVQEVGGHWGLRCSPLDGTIVTSLTWETAVGVVLNTSSSGGVNEVYYVAGVVDVHHNSLLVCHVWNGDTIVYSLHVTLIVQVPGTPLAVSVKTDPSQPTLGQPLKLTCQTSKSPPTGLTNHTTADWSHDFSNDVIMIGNMTQTSTLTFRDLFIFELRTSHAGVYNCSGQLTTVAKDQPLTKTVQQILRLSIPTATVELTTPTGESQFEIGYSASLVCTATLPSFVDTEVTGVVAWETPNGMLEKGEGRLSLYASRHGNHTYQYTLNISNIQSEDEGAYRCLVQFNSSIPSPYILSSAPAHSQSFTLTLKKDEVPTEDNTPSSSSASPETTPTNAPPTTTTPSDVTVVAPQSTTPGVVGSIVAIAIIAIVVVGVAMLVAFFALRRKPNTQIHNMDSEYAKNQTSSYKQHQSSSSASSLPSSLPFFQSYCHHPPANFHDDSDNQLYSTLDSPPPPLPPARTSTLIPPDHIPAYADSNTVIPPDHIPAYADSNTYSDPDTYTNSTDSTSVDNLSEDKGQSSSEQRFETANPLYASTNDL